jgi:ubiquinol-cytochrome c reductase cytochrome c1 subunit
MKNNLKNLLLSLVFLPFVVLANEASYLAAPIDLSDQASLQRGARTFVNNCLNCHSANYMRYNRLKDIGLTEKQIKDNLLSINPKDAKKWFGVAPPDLSVEVRARGADWVYAYLQGFYRDETSPTGWGNCVFDPQNCKVAMPHVLYELQGEQVLNHETHELELVKPGKLSPTEYSAFVGDLTNYMAFMAEPAKQQRKHIGIWALLFLSLLLVLAIKLKKEYWKDIK